MRHHGGILFMCPAVIHVCHGLQLFKLGNHNGSKYFPAYLYFLIKKVKMQQIFDNVALGLALCVGYI
jgi:hypothetical protein